MDRGKRLSACAHKICHLITIIQIWPLLYSTSGMRIKRYSSFWAATGIATSVQDASAFSNMPPGFGDLNTGVLIFGGVLAALVERRRTGVGSAVSTSLLHSGVWAVAPWSVQA